MMTIDQAENKSEKEEHKILPSPCNITVTNDAVRDSHWYHETVALLANSWHSVNAYVDIPTHDP